MKKELLENATDLMQGDERKALMWLNTPVDIFDNKSPMVHAETEQGRNEVMDFIARIRHGIFS